MYKQSSAPFISNDIFSLFSTIILTEKNQNILINSNDIPIIFLQTDLLLDYISKLLSIDTKYILLTTCNGDYCVPFFNFPQYNTDIVSITMKLLEKCSHTLT